MDPRLNYVELYQRQDRVLKAVFSAQSGFYLTGGTCIHRFYKARRHSGYLLRAASSGWPRTKPPIPLALGNDPGH